MLVIGEGSYTTEKAYLKHFMSSEYPYCLKFGNSGGYTDPAQIFKELHIVFNTMIGDAHEEKDCAFALVDLDCSKEKAEQIRLLMRKDKKFGMIVSNPCFEVWLIDHFTDQCPQYLNSQKVKKALRDQYLKDKYPDYKEGTDIYPLIADKLDIAICNEEKKQRKYKDDDSWSNPDHNPRSDMADLMKKIAGKE